MAFINEFDLRNTYSDSNNTLTKLLTVTNDLSIRVNKAVARIKSYIQHRYDPEQVFIDVLEFSTATEYTTGQLIQYTESDYVAATTYDINARVVYEDKIYKSLQGSNTGNQPDTADTFWEFVVNDNQYYVAAQDSTGNYPEDDTYWTTGDTRDPSIVDICCWLTLYDLYSGGNPRTNPEIVQIRYENAIDDLKAYQRGDRTVILPVQVDEDGDEEGHEINYGSETKRTIDF